jgi:hypothetical protein
VESSNLANFPVAFGFSRAHFDSVAPDALRAAFLMLLAHLPPLFHSAGLSPIGDLRASEKCTKTLEGMHTALTAFPQAPELCNFARSATHHGSFAR